MSFTLLVKNIGQLVTPRGNSPRVSEEMGDLWILENCYLEAKGGVITEIGSMTELPQGKIEEAQEVVDAEGKVVTPGFVDSHTHALFYGTREDEFLARFQRQDYQQTLKQRRGIQVTVEKVREATNEELYSFAASFLEEIMENGTTTIEIKSGYGLDVDNEIRSLELIQRLNSSLPLEIVPTFMGAHQIPSEYQNNRGEYIRLITEKMIPLVSERKLSKFCDISCVKGFFTLEESRSILTGGKQYGLQPKLHADLWETYGGATLAAEVEAISADYLIKISEGGITALANSKNKTIATLLPGSSFSNNLDYAPARRLIEAGVPVALATDFNPGSCQINNMVIIIALAVMKMGVTVEEAITASTLNGACALGYGQSTGSLERGKRADLIIHNLENYKQIPYFFGHRRIEKVIIQGEVVKARNYSFQRK